MARLLNILLVEDDAIEVMKFGRVLTKLKMNHKFFEANNGEEALLILNGNDFVPDIIVLDLNMPKLNGIEFLHILKKDDNLKHIPAIILTTSKNNVDLFKCYNTGIAGYIIKPLKYSDYENRIKIMLDYWSTNELISQ
tara:strand:- start:951 stop:1364 length:414 start_codon:yes stop_codon:yes gene_type:complete